MSRLTVLLPVKIVTEGKYCDVLCPQLIAYKPCCLAFEKQLDTCLGGGPLRCVECLEAERGVTVVKPESMPPIAWSELLELLNSLDIQYVKARIMCAHSTVEKAGAMIWLRKFDALREVAERKAKEAKP